MADTKISEAAVEAAIRAFDNAGAHFAHGHIGAGVWMRLALEAALPHLQGEAVPVEFDYPEFHSQGMGCGLEDRGITDRYEAMRYGFDEALDQMATILESLGPLYTHPQPAELAEQQGDALAELVEEIQDTANDWTGREAPGAAVVRGFAEKARAALAATGKDQAAEQQGVREQFEAWYSENKTVPLGAVVPLDWNDSMSTYKHWAAAEAFRVWKAALASLNHGIVDERAFDETIGQRDRYHEVADELAEHIARITGVEIGEHSSVNCPWQNAIEAAEDYKPAQADLAATGKQQVGEGQDSRAHFEARASREGYPIRRGFGAADDYGFVETRRMWQAWQAARQPGAQEPTHWQHCEIPHLCVTDATKRELKEGETGNGIRKIDAAYSIPLYAAPPAQVASNGKLVAWWNGITPGYDGQGDWSIRWGADAENSRHDIPLYDGFNPIHYQQPAQGIDLGQFRTAVDGWRQYLDRVVADTSATQSDRRVAAGRVREAIRLLALIDQRDAAPGVGQ